MQKHLFASGLIYALVFASMATAERNTHSFGNGTEFSWYGWFHFAEQIFDDGESTTSTLVDVTSAGSRFGFYLRGQSPVSFHFETGLGFRPSTKTSQINKPDFFDWDRTDLRKVQIRYNSPIGEFRIGQGSMNMDGGAEVDLGDAAIVAKSNINELFGSYEFRDGAGNLTGINLGSVFDNFDNGRRFRLRYDSPSFAGFSIGGSYGREVLKSGVDDRYYDVALRYYQRFDRFEVKGALGTAYTDVDGGGTLQETAGSISMRDDQTGLDLTVAGGQNNSGTGDYAWVKAGWSGALVAVGDTRIMAEVFRGSDYLTSGSESDMWGLSLIQNFDRQRLEAYIGYKEFSYEDTSPTTYQDASVWQIGARWKF
ncbi:porin [uncultured Shimia sp.]|uniref:porin n=1 Tax=uncultured Shimia sp. TaxID=573152 RepID=UPI00260886F2|nr:porin [uncultured Shimia sp.]